MHVQNLVPKTELSAHWWALSWGYWALSVHLVRAGMTLSSKVSRVFISWKYALKNIYKMPRHFF